jgi:arylsulfatase A-like enzyme
MRGKRVQWGALAAAAGLVIAIACQPVEIPNLPTTTTTTVDCTTTTTVDDSTTTTVEDTTTTEAGGGGGADCTSTTTATTLPPTTVTVTLPPSTTTTLSEPSGPRPDVLFVLLDDESPDTTPYYMPRTFEKMSGEHWYNFTQAVTPTSLCGPARASLLTGQTVDHHGMNCNVGNTEVCKKWAAARSKLVPKALADVGVWVGWYGKRVNWDHECKGEGPNAGWPNLPGVVDDHVHYDDKTAMFNAYQLVENGVLNQYDIATQGPSAYGTYRTADLAMAGIEACESPCTIYWMPQAPHLPGTPPPDYDPSKVVPGAEIRQPPFNEGCPGAVDPALSDKPHLLQRDSECLGTGSEWWRTKTAASLQGVDNRLPEMIDAFLAKNPDRPKKIVFTSDHGRELGNHRMTSKEDPYEMSVRVPLYIYDSEAPGGMVDELVNLRDIPATLLDWQSAPSLLPMDGRSLVPLYTGTADDWYTETYMSHLKVSSSLKYLRPWRALRQDCSVAATESRPCLKVVHYPPAIVKISGASVALPDEWEVYALDQDPWELTNLYPNAYTGYAGQPGWDLGNPHVATAFATLAAHEAAGA